MKYLFSTSFGRRVGEPRTPLDRALRVPVATLANSAEPVPKRISGGNTRIRRALHFSSWSTLYVNQSNLRYHDMLVFDMNHIKMLPNRFRNRLSVTFCFRSGNSMTAVMIIEHVRILMRGLSILGRPFSASIWMSQQWEIPVDHKRLKQAHRLFNNSVFEQTENTSNG